MNIDYEKLGVFYLGREHGSEPAASIPVLYDAKDLTTHAVCVGMTGSGKTGLCLSLLEEAAIDGIPAICIDPKGDLGNLLLTFPQLRTEDFAPWVDPAEAARRELWEETGITADQLVELGWYYRVPGVSNQKTFFFIAPVSDAALDSAPHAPLTDDIVAQRAVNLTDCLDMAQTGLIRDVAVHLACLKLQAWLNQQ